MTTDDFQRSRLARDAAAEPDEQLLAVIEQTYRQLESAYRQLEAAYRRSPAYGAMIARYPQLARAIDRCRQSDLVGEPSAPHAPRRPGLPMPSLQWERSHGDT
jgi:hypothetical protein